MRIRRKISKYNYTRVSNREIEYIVIHYVGAVSTAKANAQYFAGGNRNASAHYFVDDTSIYQSVEDKNAAWHCGGGLQGSGGHKFYKKCTNTNSIGIELCCKKKNGKLYITEKTIKRAIPLVQSLMRKYGIAAGRVIRHYDVTGKDCPAPYLNASKWAALKRRLTAGVKVKKKINLPSGLLKRGSRGTQVKRLQRCLNVVMAAGLRVDGIFGQETERCLKRFQKKYGLTADGIYGKKSKAKMKALIE